MSGCGLLIEGTRRSAAFQPWRGQLDLRYQRQGDQTQLRHQYARAPLKVQRPFYPEGPTVCHTVMLHTAGGIVGGDRLQQTIDLGRDTAALLTTAAATKIYRSNGAIAQQNITIQLAPGAVLEWLPQEAIVFNGARFEQNLRVELAPGATFLGWEIVRFGRSARGEQFVSGDWRSRLEIWQDGRPLWLDRQWLPGAPETFHSPNALAGCPVVGSLVWLGLPLTAEFIEQAQAALTERSHCHHAAGGVTPTLGDGLLCRYRGTSTTAARQALTAVWQLLRVKLAIAPCQRCASGPEPL
ncbi:MAG: urease accessory protein UreD [Spirulinaceae cyanobacterium SM2_1_0]|nr:urease accessory protein UreD [Spirulinaceae cyanobacterium SM2_1_0]